MWIGTLDGLYRKDPAALAPTSHRILPSGAANIILSIYQDRSGRLLLGTGNGVYQTSIHPTPPAAATPYLAPMILTEIQVSNQDGTTHRTPYNLDRLTFLIGTIVLLSNTPRSPLPLLNRIVIAIGSKGLTKTGSRPGRAGLRRIRTSRPVAIRFRWS